MVVTDAHCRPLPSPSLRNFHGRVMLTHRCRVHNSCRGPEVVLLDGGQGRLDAQRQ